jgi:hypothetical protein
VSSKANAPSSGSPATDKTPEPTILSIRGFTHAADGSVLAGVTVCLEDGISAGATPGNAIMCAASAADGSFGVSGAAPNSDTMLAFYKDGFAPVLRAISFQTQDITLPAEENVLWPLPLKFLGTPAEATKGHMAFVSMPADTEEAQAVSVTAARFEIFAGGSDQHGHPVYLAPDGSPDPSAISGTAGGFANLTPGIYLVQFHPDSGGWCSPSSGLYGLPSRVYGDQASVLVPVVAGYVSAPIGVTCPSTR